MSPTFTDAPRRTPLFDRHVASGARMVDFAGWEMPLNYPAGVVAEHLATRGSAGIFDVSHMGRFAVKGPDAVPFLQRVLTNDASLLAVGRSQYTLFSNPTGGALDDAYLCRFVEHEFLLVVNAANRRQDWEHLQRNLGSDRVELIDLSEELAMISLQGPASEDLLTECLETGALPEPRRNALSVAFATDGEVLLARTGYTGEPVCFEFFAPPKTAATMWDLLVRKGASPVGLGARDTLRLEAALPLYGHEQGLDPEGREIPLLACPVAHYGVNLAPTRGDFVGRTALERQKEAYRLIAEGDHSRLCDLPRLIRAVAVTGRGVARAGSVVTRRGRSIGWVTSGTMVPYWKSVAHDPEGVPAGEHELRSICLAYLDSDVSPGDEVTIDVRGKEVTAAVVERHLRNDLPPYARPVLAAAV
jgi:aminomethyltransferase